MLTPHDDFPLHQAPVPMAQTASPDPNHYDRYFFNGHTRAGDLFFAAAMGHYPNRGVVDAAFSVVADGVQRSVFASGRITPERSTRIGPISVTVLEPLRRLRVEVGPNPHGIVADAVFDAVTPAVEEPRQTLVRDGRVAMDATRLTQWGRWSGRLTVDGRTVDLDAADVPGVRDRSWGTRGVGAPVPTNLAPAVRQMFWLWAPLHFDGFCTHVAAFENGDGHRWMSTARIIPHLAGPDSATWGEDTAEHLNWWDYDLAWRPGTREISRATVTTRRLGGDAVSLEFEPLLTFRMRGIGYTHPTFGHGSAHGDLEVAGETIDLGTVDGEDPTMVHVQTLSRVHSNLGEGIGVLEQLAFGPHAPTGLVGAFSGHRA